MASHVRLQAVLIALLACNTTFYIVAGRFSEALESVAWYALLILFLLETARAPRTLSMHMRVLNHGARLIATLAILASALLYLREREWLDAINLFLWIGVVILLEAELRFARAMASRRTVFTATAVLLYAALGLLVVIWLARGEWMDAWDAALWLAAFGVLELNVLNHEKQ